MQFELKFYKGKVGEILSKEIRGHLQNDVVTFPLVNSGLSEQEQEKLIGLASEHGTAAMRAGTGTIQAFETVVCRKIDIKKGKKVVIEAWGVGAKKNQFVDCEIFAHKGHNDPNPTHISLKMQNWGALAHAEISNKIVGDEVKGANNISGVAGNQSVSGAKGPNESTDKQLMADFPVFEETDKFLKASTT